MTLLNNLQKRNDSLKSKLRHEQLKHGTYSFKRFNKEILLILGAYRSHKSILKAALSVGINKDIAMKWFIEGRKKDSEFRPFYLAINNINGFKFQEHEASIPQAEEIKKEYEISELGDSWVYTTYVDGEKISIISGDLDSLKDRVISQNLPLT